MLKTILQDPLSRAPFDYYLISNLYLIVIHITNKHVKTELKDAQNLKF